MDFLGFPRFGWNSTIWVDLNGFKQAEPPAAQIRKNVGPGVVFHVVYQRFAAFAKMEVISMGFHGFPWVSMIWVEFHDLGGFPWI